MTKDLPEDLRYFVDYNIPYGIQWNREYVVTLCQTAYYLGRKPTATAEYTSLAIILSGLLICITALILAYNK